MEGLHLKEAHEIIALLKAGSVSPLELIDVVEQRIRATDSVLHATPITCFERAREKAQQLEKDFAKRSTSRGFLHGLPVLIKDLSPKEVYQYHPCSLQQKLAPQICQVDSAVLSKQTFLAFLSRSFPFQDTHAVEGVRFTEGSLLHADRIAEKNDPLVDQLESKGAIVVGKTNVPEFCAGGLPKQFFLKKFAISISLFEILVRL